MGSLVILSTRPSGGFFFGVSMLKRLFLSLALTVFAASAWAAGTVPGFNLTTQYDLSARPAPGCKLYVIQAGTTSTPQNSYQDSGLTILNPNPLTCDAAARLPQWFVADGQIKLRLTTSTGTQIFVQDNLLVIGASSGGGGGSPVDPTTILATGDFKLVYNTGNLTGFVRCNGRTMGNATSGATERANADTSALFSFLWTADSNLAVSGGRGASAAADYAANKTITLPDCRGRALAGLGDMGNSDAGRLTTTYFGTSPTVLGAASTFLETRTLTTPNLPAYTPAGTNSTSLTSQSATQGSATQAVQPIGAAVGFGGTPAFGQLTVLAQTFTGTAQGGTSTPLSIIQPTILMTFYIKL